MISEIRRFNDLGNSRYIQLISERPNDLKEKLSALVNDLSMSVGTPNLTTSFNIPTTRLELGEAFYPILGPSGALGRYSRDALMWNWIAAKMFEHIVPDLASQSKMGQSERWVLSPSTRRYYRHFFAGAFFAYEAHHNNPKDAMAILFQPIRGGGEIVEQVQGTDEIAYSVCAGVATKLYYDSAQNKLRSGASSKNSGSSRRLVVVLNQLLVTLDLKGLGVDDIIKLLPEEFDRFKVRASTSVTSASIDVEDGFEIDDEDLNAQINHE
jgi:hypothetical protein